MGTNRKTLCPSNWDFIGINKICFLNFCGDLPPHSHSENNLKNELLDNLFQLQLSQALLERERTFKHIYSSIFEWCGEQTARSHAYRNRFKLGHHLEVGQIVLYKNHKQDLTRSQKFKERKFGPFNSTKRITNITYPIQDDKGPSSIKTVHRNHLVEYYHKEGSLPAMIEEYVPSDHQNDILYERFMEQRARDLSNLNTTEDHRSFPFPIEPLRSISSTNKVKQLSTHRYNSRITSPLASFRTLVLSPAIPLETSTPIHFLHNMQKLLNCRPRSISAQFNNLFLTVPPAWLEIASLCAPVNLITTACNQITPIFSQYWELGPDRAVSFDPFKTLPHFYNFMLHAPLFPIRSHCFYFIPQYVEQDGYDPSLWTVQLTLCSPLQLLIF